MQFTDWSVQARTVNCAHLRFGPYSILAWPAQSVNCHIDLETDFKPNIMQAMYSSTIPTIPNTQTTQTTQTRQN